MPRRRPADHEAHGVAGVRAESVFVLPIGGVMLGIKKWFTEHLCVVRETVFVKARVWFFLLTS